MQYKPYDVTVFMRCQLRRGVAVRWLALLPRSRDFLYGI